MIQYCLKHDTVLPETWYSTELDMIQYCMKHDTVLPETWYSTAWNMIQYCLKHNTVPNETWYSIAWNNQTQFDWPPTVAVYIVWQHVAKETFDDINNFSVLTGASLLPRKTRVRNLAGAAPHPFGRWCFFPLHIRWLFGFSRGDS